MSTLTNLILGERAFDDFYLEMVGESSIHGEEDNFIELDTSIFKETPTQNSNSQE
jgi:hypothetical protein